MLNQKSKLICGIIYAEDCKIEEVMADLKSHFGEIDYESKTISFNFTDYYEDEMGKNLKRKWVSFKKIINDEKIKNIKIKTMEIEKKFMRKDGTRTVNIDPGYLNLSKLVLASTKNYSHRIYLGNKIFAEVTLIYKNKKFNPLEWTYPDYKENIDIFNEIREIFKSQQKLLKSKN